MAPYFNADRTIVYPTTNARANYNSLAVMFGKDCLLFEGSLRLEQVLSTQSSVTFQIQDTTAATITEIRLNQNDAFVIEKMGLFVSKRVTAEAVSSQILHTFPNDKVFLTAAELNAVRGVYNSKMLIQLNDIVYGKSIDTTRFLRSDEAQAGVAVSTVATTGVMGASSFEGNRNFISLTPNIILNGTSNNSITVQFPESLVFTPAAAQTNSLVLICRGTLVQNGGRMRS